MGVAQFEEHYNESCYNEQGTKKTERFTDQKTTAHNGHGKGYDVSLDTLTQ
jgi:uncharacterized protein YxeA